MFRIPEEFRQYCQGQAEVPHLGDTVQASLEQLAKEYPKLASRVVDDHGQLMPHLVVLHKGEVITRDRTADWSVAEADVLEIYTAASGG